MSPETGDIGTDMSYYFGSKIGYLTDYDLGKSGPSDAESQSPETFTVPAKPDLERQLAELQAKVEQQEEQIRELYELNAELRRNFSGQRVRQVPDYWAER